MRDDNGEYTEAGLQAHRALVDFFLTYFAESHERGLKAHIVAFMIIEAVMDAYNASVMGMTNLFDQQGKEDG